MIEALAEAMISYLVGSLNFAYLLSKIFNYDILSSKEVFDENFGAYNVYRATKSKALFILVASLDVLKAILVSLLFGVHYSIFVLLGHNFSIITYAFTRRICTGMGLSVLFGSMLLYDPRIILIYLLIYLFHKITLRRKMNKKEWLIGHHLYTAIHVAIAGLLYYSIFNKNDLWFFSAMYLIFATSSIIRWKKTIEKV